MIKFGLVTVLYNSVDVLDGFFKSLAIQIYSNWHLEVIDNSLGEETISRARELAAHYGFSSVNFVRNPDNYGVAKGNNQGIENCLKLNCDYIVLLNNDIEFPENLFAGIVDEINKNGYEILVPKVYYYDTGKIWYGGGRINVYSANIKQFGDGEADSSHYCADRFTGYAPTCFMTIKSDVFIKVGLMDEQYFVYCDDTDFVLRCLRAGLKLRYLGRLVLYHKVSSSTGGSSSKFSIYYGNRNRFLFIRKNIHGIIFIIAMSWSLATRFYKYCMYSKDDRKVLAKAVKDGLLMKLIERQPR